MIILRSMIFGLYKIILVMIVAGCANTTHPPLIRVGASSKKLTIAGLDECDDQSSTTLNIDPSKPLVVVVHGCHASGGRFRAMANVFEAHGQQTICFNYDDRESLVRTSHDLVEAVSTLAEHLPGQPVTILGHSQGGLVSRRALIHHLEKKNNNNIQHLYRLVTVSSPFNGIAASSHCSKTSLHIATLGISAGICRLIAGNKWTEIHPKADFMQSPGTLNKRVSKHLKIVTDEAGSCRRFADNGECIEDDYVFSVDEQMNRIIEKDGRVQNITVKAGHVEIVGDRNLPPMKLITVLQKNGILNPTAPEQQAALLALLKTLY